MSEPACPRCAGLVANLYDDPHCLNCGWRRCEPVQRNQIERAVDILDERRKASAERNRQYMREYWERKKKGVKPRAYVKRKAAQA